MVGAAIHSKRVSSSVVRTRSNATIASCMPIAMRLLQMHIMTMGREDTIE
jgi:hypothetical protein